MDNTSFLYLADSIRNEDDRQDAYLALLECQPETLQAATAILITLERRRRSQVRGRPLQLSIEPWTDDVNPSSIHAAIAQLPAAEAELIHAHYISGLTIRSIAADTDRSVTSTQEALTLAVRKLTAILCE